LGDKKNGFYKKRSDHPNFYAMLLPIPDRLENLASLEWENFVSYIEVENLLSEEFLNQKDENGNYLFVEEKEAPGGMRYYKFKGKKKNFWKKLFELKEDDFKDFSPIFEKINELFSK